MRKLLYILLLFGSIVQAQFSPVIGIIASQGGTGIVGYDDYAALTSTTTSTNLRAMKAIMPENGTIVSISIYHNDVGDTNDLIMGIYDDSSTTPNDLLATTALATDLVAGWNTLDLVSSVYVTNGTVIWIAFSSQAIDIKYLDLGTGTTDRASGAAGLQSPLLDPFGTADVTRYTYAIYATYTK